MDADVAEVIDDLLDMVINNRIQSGSYWRHHHTNEVIKVIVPRAEDELFKFKRGNKAPIVVYRSWIDPKSVRYSAHMHFINDFIPMTEEDFEALK